MAATITGRRKDARRLDVSRWRAAPAEVLGLVTTMARRLAALGLQVVATLIAGLVAWLIVSAGRTLRRARRREIRRGSDGLTS